MFTNEKGLEYRKMELVWTNIQVLLFK